MAVLRMNDVGGKLLSEINSMYADSLPYVRAKGSESEWFKIDIWAKQRCIISPWLFNVCMDAVLKEVKMGNGKEGNKIPGGWERVEITWPLVRR